ncbi:MAG: MCE family protein [Mycolicibacterium hassiacum]|uniref:MCE family protein n=1 Tax=Mycolicibacterium hassiacum TaxID=46351 RepID=UPI0023F9857E|nr:MCE family protein [Mycolicibacterium hassiacum]MBX5488034.1 MCE family protein [Mycolicibacterium hassiacum]
MSVDRHDPPYRPAGVALLLVAVVAAGLLYGQFRGSFADTAEVTVQASRAGLVVEPGAKVTYHGVEIGRVGRIRHADTAAGPAAELDLQITRRYLETIPANVTAEIRATTVFGNKYISLDAPENPLPERLSNGAVLTAGATTTEFNTVFETITAIAERIDPIKLNQTLSATAQALTGLGARFGASLAHGNAVLDDLNARMPLLNNDIRLLADLAAVYRAASPQLWDGLESAATTAATVNERRAGLDSALLAAVGFGGAASVFERAGPYFLRGAADLVPTTRLLDDYRGMIFCTIRNFNEIEEVVARTLGGNGYSLSTSSGTIAGGGNPYIYPDNLPRVNARGGPGGRPGCWQKVTRELWPAPYLVMDTGASIAPYNHLEIGQPMLVDYVWGRQLGEYTINP